MLIVKKVEGSVLDVVWSPVVSCHSVASADLVARLAAADVVSVRVPKWRQLPRRLKLQLQTLEKGLTPEPLAQRLSRRQLEQRLVELEGRLRAHARHLLLGELVRDEPGAPPCSYALLVAAPLSEQEMTLLSGF